MMQQEVDDINKQWQMFEMWSYILFLETPVHPPPTHDSHLIHKISISVGIVNVLSSVKKT